MIAVGLMLVAAGIIVLIAAEAQAVQNRSYAACSETVRGTITRKQSRKLKNGTSHELTVAYLVNGISYQKVVGALLTEYQTMSEGDQIELRYQPDNPKKAVRPRELNPRNIKILLLFSAALIVAGIVLFVIGRM